MTRETCLKVLMKINTSGLGSLLASQQHLNEKFPILSSKHNRLQHLTYMGKKITEWSTEERVLLSRRNSLSGAPSQNQMLSVTQRPGEQPQLPASLTGTDQPPAGSLLPHIPR